MVGQVVGVIWNPGVLRRRTSLAVVIGLMLVAGLLTPAAAGAADDAEGFPAGEQQLPPDGIDIAVAYVQSHLNELGLTSSDIDDLLVTDHYTTTHNGVTHVYLRQRYQGIEVYGADLNVNIAADGTVLSVGNRSVAGLEKSIADTEPGLSEIGAVRRAAARLGLRITGPLNIVQPPAGPGRRGSVDNGGIARSPIGFRLVYQPVAVGDIRLAWNINIEQLDGEHWWDTRVDATTGEELDRTDWVVTDQLVPAAGAPAVAAGPAAPIVDAPLPQSLDGSTYRVYELPVESPLHGARSLVSDPADATASPFGWHDTNGAAGPEFTDTRGNNVHAYPDPGFSPDGGPGLDFDFPIDLAQDPSTYQPAAVTNLFYWNNLIHDVFYPYGFDEAAGNFQENNYGNGGVGSDSVNAEAQDAAGNCNANFATPTDGSNPTMQMYKCNLVSPSRDGDLDNAVIVHEYGHGISNRLTGGPFNVSCLNNQEQAGEGWSDFFGLMLTMGSADAGTDARGIGTYLIGQAADGPGIRDYPYSTNMGTDPRTYDAIKTASVPHGVGSTFAAMLWEMTWGLIDVYGFDSDLFTGTGGNNLALQLVVDGLKLQPCSPGFVDARDAILLADQVNNGSANQCLIWEAFAKRGLGFSAGQGSPFSVTDGTEAFDIPVECDLRLKIFKSASPDSVSAGGALTYTLDIVNDSLDTRTGVTVTDAVPAGTTYLPGSADCSGSEAGGVVTFVLGPMVSGASVTCSFGVMADAGPGSAVVFEDDLEAGGAKWDATSGVGTNTWALGTANPHSPTRAFFADDVAVVTDQYLTLAAPVQLTGVPLLSFWHDFNTETGYDGGVVEISVNGGPWADLGPQMVTNGYTGTISTAFSNPIAGRQAFTGNSGGYLLTEADLSSFAGSSVQIRFRMATDTSVSDVGWYVDDVSISEEVSIVNTACVESDQSISTCDTVETLVLPTPPPVVDSEVLSIGGADHVAVLFVDQTSGQSWVDVRDVATGSLVSSVSFGSTYVGSDLEVMADTGDVGSDAELVVLGTSAAGLVRATAKDGVTGALVGRANYGDAYSGGDLEIVSGDDVAVMGVRHTNGNVRVQTRTLASSVVSTAFLGNAWSGADLEVLGGTDLGVLGTNHLTGNVRVRSVDFATGAVVATAYWGNAFTGIDAEALGSDWVVLQQRLSNGAVRVQARSQSGVISGTAGFGITSFAALQVDTVGSNVAVLGISWVNQAVRVQTRTPAGGLVGTANFGTAYSGIDLEAAGGDVAVLGVKSSNGKIRDQLRTTGGTVAATVTYN